MRYWSSWLCIFQVKNSIHFTSSLVSFVRSAAVSINASSSSLTIDLLRVKLASIILPYLSLSLCHFPSLKRFFCDFSEDEEWNTRQMRDTHKQKHNRLGAKWNFNVSGCLIRKDLSDQEVARNAHRIYLFFSGIFFVVVVTSTFSFDCLRFYCIRFRWVLHGARSTDALFDLNRYF